MTRRGQRPRWVAATLFLALGLGATASCDSFSTFCQELIDCEDGNDADVDACITQLGAESDRASTYGCGEWFDLYQECREAQSECKNDNYGVDGSDCDEERNDYKDCMSG